jgi:hypothetical protein
MTYCVRAFLTRRHEIPLISGNALVSVDDKGLHDVKLEQILITLNHILPR